MAEHLSAEDRLEIAEIVSRWSHCEDAGDAEGWARLFAPDGSCRNGSGKLMRGHAELLEGSRSRAALPSARGTAHWMGGTLIEPVAGGARARHYGMILRRTPDGLSIASLSDRIYDLRRTDGAWKIMHRDISRLPSGARTQENERPQGGTRQNDR
ncbi:nuclear transport factor 2 family protein [Poseidonocella sp. HB161398]|uniref:nuclear transport factor 2 family protein n=1 Tax=Poseidonocella sp. HB161398 TaxID=2320855 RepID=UPI001108DAA6|nr:nuclear transport factor 2 family protein [Poseidonocella sp. HB161398]